MRPGRRPRSGPFRPTTDAHLEPADKRELVHLMTLRPGGEHHLRARRREVRGTDEQDENQGTKDRESMAAVFEHGIPPGPRKVQPLSRRTLGVPPFSNDRRTDNPPRAV